MMKIKPKRKLPQNPFIDLKNLLESVTDQDELDKLKIAISGLAIKTNISPKTRIAIEELLKEY